jgi:hypothetical protein
MEELPNDTIYRIYIGILRAMKKEGIRVEERDNVTIIHIGDPTKKDIYLTIEYYKAKDSTETYYELSGSLAKEVAMGIGQHFPIFESLDELVEKLSYVGVRMSIKNSEKKCAYGSKYCREIGVYIYMVREPQNNPKQYEIQPEPLTELGLRLAESSLEELLDLVVNNKINVSVSDDGTIYIEPVFIYSPSNGRGLQSYTLSGELAKDLIKQIGRYIPLPGGLKEAEIVRVTWGFNPQGYEIELKTEIEPIFP